MATATTLPNGGVSLALSAAEAEFLMQVMRRIGGDPIRSPRKHADDIHDALLAAAVEEASHLFYASGHSHSLHFLTPQEG